MKIPALILALATLPVVSTFAEDDGFAAYDTDNDGTVTYAELGRTKKLDFDRMDRNRDKQLSEEEFAAGAKAKEEGAVESLFDTPEFAALDLDKNGQLSLAEFGTSIKNMIAGLDKSSDSAVSQEEYVAAVKAIEAAAKPAPGMEKKGSAAKKGSAPKTTTTESKKTDT